MFVHHSSTAGGILFVEDYINWSLDKNSVYLCIDVLLKIMGLDSE